MGRTLAVIKPETFDQREEIKTDIKENDFHIVKNKTLRWHRELIERTYTKEKLNYGSERANEVMSLIIPDLIFDNFGENPKIEALILSSKGNTIEDFVRLCGPTNAFDYLRKEFEKTLRGKYGLGPEKSFVKTIDGIVCRFYFNGTHRTSTQEEYEEEKEIYFGKII